jgi:hypothetical protein
MPAPCEVESQDYVTEIILQSINQPKSLLVNLKSLMSSRFYKVYYLQCTNPAETNCVDVQGSSWSAEHYAVKKKTEWST